MGDEVAVLTKLIEEQPTLRLTISGEPLKSKHHQALKHHPHLEIVSVPAGRALRDVFRSLDLFLFTSDETEAFGNPALEAMGSGRAVVTTAVGAIPSYSEDKISALHCSPRDTQTMLRLANDLIDQPELRQSLSESARTSALQHQWINQGKNSRQS